MEDSKQSEDAKTFEHLSKLRNEAQNANSIMMQRREEDEVQSPPPPVDEDPAVEGLLLLQHFPKDTELGSGVAHPDEKTEDSSGILKISAVTLREGGMSEESNSNRTEFEDRLNPLKKLVLDGIDGLELCVQNAFLEHYRGVFLHEQLSMYYALVSYNGSFHFLGFHSSAASAARAWDLAALKRSIDNGKSLSMARTNFSFDRYMQLENILGILVVLTFSGLVELLKSFTFGTSQISAENLEKVNFQIQLCNEAFINEAFINEEGNVSIPSELREVILNSAKTSSKIQTFTPDQLSNILTKSCSDEAISRDNEWIKTIRNNHPWKGVYFTRDGYPYSKVEMDGEFKYLGKFETIESAARAFDLATLKRAMMNNESFVSLNFSTEDYIKHEQLMSFLYFADTDQVTGFIVKMTQGNKAKNYTSSISTERAEFDQELGANKRKKMETTSEPMACLNSWGLTPTSDSVQHIDWSSLNFRPSSAPPPETPIQDQGPSQPPPVQDLPPSPGKDMEIEEEEIFIDSSINGRKNEFRTERRICDENMARMLRDSSGWVRVARNAVALKMTSALLQITNQQYTSFPAEVSTWIAPHSGEVERQQHIVELLDPFHKQSFHLMCYLSKDGTYTFSSTTWNEFIEDIGLTVHDILVLLDRKTSWKLSYAVFILSDDVLATGGGGPSRDPGPVQELGGPRSTGMMFRPMASTPPPMLTAVPMAQPPVKLTQMMPNPGRRTLQAHVLPTAQNLTNIRIIQKVQDGRLLVQASLTSFPASRGLFIIPANSIQSWPMKFVPGGPMGYGPGSTTGSTKRQTTNPPPRVMSMGAAVSTGGGPARVHGPNNFHLQTHPACLPAAPIQLNIRGGFQALAKKNDVSLYMVTDSNGQMRLITSQSGVPPTNQIAPFRHTVETGRPQGLGSGIRREDRNQAPIRGTRMDSPEIMTLTSTASETSEPRMDDFGETIDKDQIVDQVNDQEEGKVEVTSPAPVQGLESGKKEGENFEDPEESLTSMHCQMKRILEQCQGLSSDLARQYRFAFANKMNEGQRIANFMEIKTMSEAGEWKEIIEWINSTLESL